MDFTKTRIFAFSAIALAAVAAILTLHGQDTRAGFAPEGTAAIGPSGGSVPLLNFAVIGDSRPANNDDTAGYPSAIIQQIYSDVEATAPHPDFVVATGDYMYNTPGKGNAAAQASLYVRAAQNFTGQVFPAIGNHECTGWTKSECGSDNPDGLSENYTVYLKDILQGFGIDSKVPYFVIRMNSSDLSNPWTAKFVFVAPNAWDATQATWLAKQMSQKTTFTFVVKHEAAYDDSECPGCGASDTILKKYPVTLYLYGHTHTYEYVAPNSLIVGNGGAPLDGPSDQFGYVTCQQQTDNSITCSEHDYNSDSSSYKNSTVTVSASGVAK